MVWWSTPGIHPYLRVQRANSPPTTHAHNHKHVGRSIMDKKAPRMLTMPRGGWSLLWQRMVSQDNLDVRCVGWPLPAWTAWLVVLIGWLCGGVGWVVGRLVGRLVGWLLGWLVVDCWLMGWPQAKPQRGAHFTRGRRRGVRGHNCQRRSVRAQRHPRVLGLSVRTVGQGLLICAVAWRSLLPRR